jgi:DUF1365 family protein
MAGDKFADSHRTSHQGRHKRRFYPRSNSTYAVLMPALSADEVRDATDELVHAANRNLSTAGFRADMSADVKNLSHASVTRAELESAFAAGFMR